MNAYRYHTTVKEKGTIDLPEIPLPKGAKVGVIILPENESLEMMQAAESSIKFWDNPADDATWEKTGVAQVVNY